MSFLNSRDFRRRPKMTPNPAGDPVGLALCTLRDRAAQRR